MAHGANLMVAAGILGQQNGQSLEKGVSQPCGVPAPAAGGQGLGRGLTVESAHQHLLPMLALAGVTQTS